MDFDVMTDLLDNGPRGQLTLRPDRPKAALWSGLALGLIAFAAWFVQDTGGGDAFMWIVLAVAISIAAYFLLQFAMPSWFEIHLDSEGMRARTVWQHLDVSWSEVESAQIRELVGEPYLRLNIIEERDGGWVVNPATVLVPIGADTGALRMSLARVRAVGRLSMDQVVDAA